MRNVYKCENDGVINNAVLASYLAISISLTVV